MSDLILVSLILIVAFIVIIITYGLSTVAEVQHLLQLSQESKDE